MSECLCLDIIKASDTVDCITLLIKSYNVGTKGVEYKWFLNYLLEGKP